MIPATTPRPPAPVAHQASQRGNPVASRPVPAARNAPDIKKPDTTNAWPFIETSASAVIGSSVSGREWTVIIGAAEPTLTASMAEPAIAVTAAATGARSNVWVTSQARSTARAARPSSSRG